MADWNVCAGCGEEIPDLLQDAEGKWWCYMPCKPESNRPSYAQHVWYDVETKSWGFWDEAGLAKQGYLSEKEALDARDAYARELNKQVSKGGAQ